VQRGVLTTLRVLSLVTVFLFACRPIILLPPANAGDIVVPVLVDASRSMRVADADGESRISLAQTLVKSQILPALEKVGKPEVFRVGEALTESSVEGLVADGRRTDLAGAVAAARERFRGRRVAGIVVLSDGGDTGQSAQTSAARAGAPVFAIGVGSAEGVPDREVVGITAGDPRLDQALVDLHVTTVARGLGRDAYSLRMLANGQLVESRRIVPGAEGTPTDETFVVTPDPLNATVYTAEIVADAREAIRENNTRSVLLSPAARKRRLLILGGSPGYEHSFLVRALSHDPSFEIDSIVRKGKDDSGRDTFLIQAGGGRGAALTTGFPTTRESLFGYDTVIIGNLEGEFFGRAQMELLADFVSVRGGGLLLLGARTFLQRGIAGSPLEEALPVELNDRKGGLVRASLGSIDLPPHNKITLTADGETHPIMRIGANAGETRKLWSALPALAASAMIGAPRPGATILALTTAPGGGVFPVVAVQPYGHGRSMIFGGEACPQNLVARWYRAGRTILNSYGPTEATVTATLTELTPDKSVTIGVPLPTYSIVILDPVEDKTVPTGELGEIGIAGVGLALGYLNRDELTMKKFIRDFLQIPNNPSGRIYRTGDLGRIDADGEIDYRGRIDSQVKIRGYRIELSEIEAVLLGLPQIAQAAVITFEPEPGLVELVAYYAFKQGADLPRDEISLALRGKLPPYMVPAYLEELPSIPMTLSNKADHKKLPKPRVPRFSAGTGYVPPKTESERVLSAALCALLRTERVSTEHHFFDELGANSLLMARVCANIRKNPRMANVSMRDIYTNPTIARLAVPEMLKRYPGGMPAIRYLDQPQNSQGAWSRRASDIDCSRRRGHRIKMLFAAVHESGCGTKRTSQPDLRMSASGAKDGVVGRQLVDS